MECKFVCFLTQEGGVRDCPNRVFKDTQNVTPPNKFLNICCCKSEGGLGFSAQILPRTLGSESCVDLRSRFPIANCALVSCAQDDWAGWVDFNAKVGGKIQTVGDDLTVTNIKRIKTAAEKNACNALLLKVFGAKSCSVVRTRTSVYASACLLVVSFFAKSLETRFKSVDRSSWHSTGLSQMIGTVSMF